MFFFSEKYVIPEEEEEYEAATPQLQNQQQTPEINHEEDGLSNPNEGETEQEALLTAMRSSMCRTSLGKAAIPYVLFLSSLIVSLGSGASVKYFPLFFKELGLGSAAVQSIFLAVPVFISAFSFLATQLSKKIGRVETTVLSDVIGTSLLYAMNCLSRDVQRNSDEQDTLWFKNPHRVILITAVYLFRTGIINSCYPLLESILMDNVPSNQRARWKSLESIASFGWTGSALIGGILSDEHSYQFTFTITAAMQLSGGLILLLIQPFVEAEE
jgi:MFS family permease